jgi:predicted Rossmann fold flavoprotein
MKFDVVVIGGGAAGLFCAIEAAKRGRKTVVLEHNAEVGRKIIISGGGRCNFTNINTRPENFVSENPHFAKSAVARYTPEDFVRLVKKHGIEFYEKKLGQLFCRTNSRQIVEMLLSECRRSNVAVKTGVTVREIRKDDRFLLETSSGDISCASVVIATGGLSFTKIGATDFGYRVARQFGLKIVPTRPSLVPLVFENGKGFSRLAGVSVDSVVSAGGENFRENILFTHRGLSGPAVLQVSNYWVRGEPVSIDLVPGESIAARIGSDRDSRQLLDNYLARFLPARFAEVFVAANIANKPLNELSNKSIEKVAAMLNDWQVRFSETEGYDKAEVTSGGVSTDGLSSQTMEAKKIPGLYFIGEVVDVTGWLGGYNFQWAWSSGHAAGQAV